MTTKPKALELTGTSLIYRTKLVGTVQIVTTSLIKQAHQAAKLIGQTVVTFQGNFETTEFLFDAGFDDEDEFEAAQTKLRAAGFLE